MTRSTLGSPRRHLRSSALSPDAPFVPAGMCSRGTTPPPLIWRPRTRSAFQARREHRRPCHYHPTAERTCPRHRYGLAARFSRSRPAAYHVSLDTELALLRSTVIGCGSLPPPMMVWPVSICTRNEGSSAASERERNAHRPWTWARPPGGSPVQEHYALERDPRAGSHSVSPVVTSFRPAGGVSPARISGGCWRACCDTTDMHSLPQRTGL